ncbi:MAG: TlpA family protein disulfide reductase [Planctomycetes bacterium]|nr:TlpA family protein disulfide reductase [Planctomycetota bacterium]
MRHWILKGALLTLLIGIVAWIFIGPRTAGPPPSQALDPLEAQPAPDVRLATLDGGEISLADLRDNVVLLDFWATWCPPCREMIPILQTLHYEYQSRGLAVVGVALDQEGPAVVRPFVRKFGVQYQIAMPNPSLLEAFGPIHAIPVLVVLDRNGRIRQRLIGVHSREDLEALVVALLAEEKSSKETIP